MVTKKNLAIIYLTKNHPDTIRDVLGNCIELYKQNEIDVYYFDSSDNNETKDICDKYRNAGFENLYYYRNKSEYTFDEKLLDIFSGKYEFIKDYRYIWPIKDRECFVGPLLQEVIRLVYGQYGIIYLGITRRDIFPDFIRENTVMYDDIKEFYMNWGWQSASLSVTLYNTECLQEFDWDKFVCDTKWYSTNWFTHYVVLFNILSQNQDLKIPVIGGKFYEDGVYSSEKSSSTWKKERFITWINKWYDANSVLPDIYEDYKEYVIKSNTALSNIIGTQTDLIRYYQEGVFGIHVWSSVAEKWEYATSIPSSDAQLIAEGKLDSLASKILSRISKEVNLGFLDLAILEYNNNMWMANNIEYADIFGELGSCLKVLLQHQFDEQ